MTKLKVITLIVALIASVSLTSLAEEDKQATVANLVRALGYGGAIHQFKNYVIRGTDNYPANATQFFTKAATEAAILVKSVQTDEARTAVKDITEVITAYQAALPTIAKLVSEGKSAKDIDAVVKISDQPALDGLAVLRK